MDREQFKNPSILFKLWITCVRVLNKINTIGWKSHGRPMLYSYQRALPSLPLPSVNETLTKHLRSMRPLVSDSEYDNLIELSHEFETGIAPKLQRYLKLKWLWSDNYVSDWWEEYVYLRGRAPLMINSNYYGIERFGKPPTSNQAARAANLIHSAFCFRRLLLKQDVEPLMLKGMIPMCSSQYERLFNTTRIPGHRVDTLLHLDDSTHIAVMHKGRFFRCGCYSNGRLLNPAELQWYI